MLRSRSSECDIRVRRDRCGMVTQVQQDRETALLATSATAPLAYLPRCVAKQRGLPASRRTDDRQYPRIWLIEEFVECPAFGDVGRQVRQQPNPSLTWCGGRCARLTSTKTSSSSGVKGPTVARPF